MARNYLSNEHHKRQIEAPDQMTHQLQIDALISGDVPQMAGHAECSVATMWERCASP